MWCELQNVSWKSQCCLTFCSPSIDESSWNSSDIKRLQYPFGNRGPRGAHFHVAITAIPSRCSAKYTLFLPVNPTAFFPSCSSTDRCCYRHTAPLNPQRAYIAEHATKYHYITIHQVWQPTASGNSISKNFTFSSKSQLKISNIRITKT